MTKEYRKAIDISTEAAELAFDQLPAALFAAPKTFYANRVFKNAPTWAKGVKLVPAVNELLDGSKGYTIHHKSLLAQFKHWATVHGIQLSSEDQDEVILSLRSVVCQLSNHKKNTRSVPKSFSRIYAVVWSKVAAAPQAHPEDKQSEDQARPEDEQGEVEIMLPEREPAEFVDLTSDDKDDYMVEKAVLFSSDNPTLNTLLQDTEKTKKKQRRLRGKSTDDAIPKLDLGMSLQGLTETKEEDISPKTFKELNKQLKDKAKGGSKKKAMKKARKKTTKKAMKKVPKKTVKGTKEESKKGVQKGVKKGVEKMTDEQKKAFNALLKREHSNAYIAAKKKAKAKGATESEIKAAASKAGCAKSAELRLALAEGRVDYEGNKTRKGEDVN